MDICIAVSSGRLRAFDQTGKSLEGITLSDDKLIEAEVIERKEYISWYESAYKKSFKQDVFKILGVEPQKKQKHKKELSTREKRSFLNLIGALHELLLAKWIPKKGTKNMIIQEITLRYPRVEGLSKATLDARLKRCSDCVSGQIPYVNDSEKKYFKVIFAQMNLLQKQWYSNATSPNGVDLDIFDNLEGIVTEDDYEAITESATAELIECVPSE